MGDGELSVRFDDGRQEILAGEQLGRNRLDHAYAVTAHRMQGATVDRAHVVADGGGRELAYVAMSRARDTSHVYAVADDTDQAVDDLVVEWSVDRRQRWIIDTDAPADASARRRPDLATRGDDVLRQARLRAERAAVDAAAPEATDRLRTLDLQLRLERVGHDRPAVHGLGLA